MLVWYILPLTLLTTSGLLYMYSLHHRFDRWLLILFSALIVICLYCQTIMMRPLSMKLDTKEFTDVYGDARKPVLFHWHEIYHYYLGSKYFPENGYKGLYESTILADDELDNPRFNHEGLRSLANPMYDMTWEEGMDDARKVFRPRFTDQRWEEFKHDLQALEDIGDDDDLHDVIWDAGYNPPPTWAVFGTTVANLIPISEDQAWFKNLRPYWYQAHWLPLIDAFMISTATLFLLWAFGYNAAGAFVCIYCCSVFAQYNWTSGSFFRWTWVSELMIGSAMLKKDRYFTGGLFLGLSAVDRIFPIGFTIGGALPLLWGAVSRREYRPFVRYSIGAGLAIVGMFAISVALFGFDAWRGFEEKILLHKDTIFMHSVGYMRVAVFSPDIAGQWLPTLADFRHWNERLFTIWHQIEWRHYPVLALLLGSCVVAALRITAYESALMFGGMLFFTTQVTTAYYYIYFPLILVVVSGSPSSRIRDYILFSVFGLQTYTWLALMFSQDEIWVNYYNCIGLLVFFAGWAFLRAFEAMRYYQTPATPDMVPVAEPLPAIITQYPIPE